MRYIVLLFLLPSICLADSWDKYDYALYGAYSVATYTDWRQTQYIANNPILFEETNKKIGTHPSISTVNHYFLKRAMLETSMAYIIPGWYRKLFLGGMTIYEFDAVHHNRSIGIKFSF